MDEDEIARHNKSAINLSIYPERPKGDHKSGSIAPFIAPARLTFSVVEPGRVEQVLLPDVATGYSHGLRNDLGGNGDLEEQ